LPKDFLSRVIANVGLLINSPVAVNAGLGALLDKKTVYS